MEILSNTNFVGKEKGEERELNGRTTILIKSDMHTEKFHVKSLGDGTWKKFEESESCHFWLRNLSLGCTG